MILLLPSQSTVLHAYAVLLGMTPGNAAFKDHQAYIASQTNAGYLSAVESYFAGTSTATLASSALTNLRVGYRLAPKTQLALDVYNLFDRKVNDIEYWYDSQLPGESAAVFDRHIHPSEPRSFRLTLSSRF